MDDFIAARSQMALSLGFHIIFSCIGMVMPFFMAVSHYYWIKTKQPVYLNITRAWSKGVAIFFATGAVSGTVLSFELGLLWPNFMKHAGPIFGMPFSLEGTAFFIEAIALGFYLYGWDRFNKWFHWITGVIVGVSGLASGILVVAANAWMNTPAGFDYVNGQFINIDPIAAMFNKAWFSQALHMCLAAFIATGFAVAGVHAYMVLRNKNVLFHSKAFRIAAIFAVISALLQPISGDRSAKHVAKYQPAKLAAMEAHFETGRSVPLIIGGIPDEKNKTVKYALKIPGLLSLLAHGDFDAEVKGLDSIPPENHPPVAITHYAFQVMVGLGSFLALVSLIYLLAIIKKRSWLNKRWLLKLFVISVPLGYIAVEAGWIVTEVGRQPWIIHGIMRTKDAVTPMPGIVYSFYLFTAVYISLALIVTFLLHRQIRMVPEIYDVPNQKRKRIVMLYVVMIFLWVSILLYLLLGGADFGAGIIELFTSPKNKSKTRQTMYHAIGPIWEANHMWLIIAIVILFVGFPVIYTTMSVYLHIPLAIMLLGIIARGTAFAFRHYDAVIDDMQKIYNKVFVYSSFVTPLFLGIIAGSAVSGKIDTEANNFVDAYIFSWLNLFSIATGLFTVAICGYLAAIYIIGETTDPTDRSRFIKKARLSTMAAFVSGALVFFAGYFESVPIFKWIFGNPVSLVAICAALASLLIQGVYLKRRRTNPIRILAGFQVTMILLAVTVKHYPNVVLMKDGKALSLLEHAGHEQTIFYLGTALLIGSVFILPALYYLIYSFHRKTI